MNCLLGDSSKGNWQISSGINNKSKLSMEMPIGIVEMEQLIEKITCEQL